MAYKCKRSSQLVSHVPQFLCRCANCPAQIPKLSAQRVVRVYQVSGPGACAAATVSATAPDPRCSAVASATVAPPAVGLLIVASPHSAACAPEKMPCVSAKYTRACSSTYVQRQSEANSAMLSCQDQLMCSGHYRTTVFNNTPAHDAALTR